MTYIYDVLKKVKLYDPEFSELVDFSSSRYMTPNEYDNLVKKLILDHINSKEINTLTQLNDKLSELDERDSFDFVSILRKKKDMKLMCFYNKLINKIVCENEIIPHIETSHKIVLFKKILEKSNLPLKKYKLFISKIVARKNYEMLKIVFDHYIKSKFGLSFFSLIFLINKYSDIDTVNELLEYMNIDINEKLDPTFLENHFLKRDTIKYVKGGYSLYSVDKSLSFCQSIFDRYDDDNIPLLYFYFIMENLVSNSKGFDINITTIIIKNACLILDNDTINIFLVKSLHAENLIFLHEYNKITSNVKLTDYQIVYILETSDYINKREFLYETGSMDRLKELIGGKSVVESVLIIKSILEHKTI